MDEGNTLLDHKELHMLVVLRMNRPFMEYMRARHGDLSKQLFGQTVVPSRDPQQGLAAPVAPRSKRGHGGRPLGAKTKESVRGKKFKGLYESKK